MIVSIMLVQISCSGQSAEKTSQSKKTNNQMLMENQGRTYSVVFLNITDQKGYEQYRKSTDKLRKKYGGHIEREFDVMGQKGNIPDFEAPNKVIVMYWDNPDGHQLLMNDEKYQKALTVLKTSTSSIRAVRGTSQMFQSSTSDETGRMWLIKISYYKDNTAGRLDMLQEIGDKLTPYGFYTERMVMVDEASGFDQPSEVTVHFHDFAYQNEELQNDASVTGAIGEYNQKYLTHFVYLPLKLR